MGKSLFDLMDEDEAEALELPEQDPRGRNYFQVEQDFEKAEEMKRLIHGQLDEGRTPQSVLCTALRTIGVLTNDMEWAEEQVGILDSVYKDLAQQSFLDDNAAIAQSRLDDMGTKYREKVRKSINAHLKGYQKMERALITARDELDKMDGIDPGELFDWNDSLPYN